MRDTKVEGMGTGEVSSSNEPTPNIFSFTCYCGKEIKSLYKRQFEQMKDAHLKSHSGKGEKVE